MRPRASFLPRGRVCERRRVWPLHVYRGRREALALPTAGEPCAGDAACARNPTCDPGHAHRASRESSPHVTKLPPCMQSCQLGNSSRTSSITANEAQGMGPGTHVRCPIAPTDQCRVRPPQLSRGLDFGTYPPAEGQYATAVAR